VIIAQPGGKPCWNVGHSRDNGQVAVVTVQDESVGQAVQVKLLGQFSVSARGRVVAAWPRPSARRLCELVLVSPGWRVSRDVACEELFPRLEPRAAARALSKALSMARSALAELGTDGTALLMADLNHIWASPDIVVDAEVCAEALRAGLALASGQLRDDQLSSALAQDGELLADEPYADWANRVRDRLTALRQEARLGLARDRAAGAGRSGRADVLAAWESCLDHDPACEEAAGALIRAYLAQGRPELAARVFERCREALVSLGLRIPPSLERLYAPARDPGPEGAPARDPGPASGWARDPGLASAPPPVVPPPLPREERRPVTVLFAEVAAPAGLASAVGLETLRELVGGSLAAVIAEVEGLGGTVTSVSGRGLQAMFGAPEAHEDDPERAVLAAFRALSATATAAAATEGGTALRIGVETGPAVVGPIGGGAKVEYGALGDVVSVAAALQSAARPGAVLVGPATRAVTGHLFTWGGGKEVALGPSMRPLVASYLELPRARAVDRRPRVGGRAALVGRDAELGVLDAALRDAVDGRGSVALLTGDAGLGKTRLVQECRKRFIAWVGAGSGRLPLWLEGRGASYASSTPYGLYRQLVASWIGVAPDEPAARVQAALERSLTHLMGNANLLPPLARMMGIASPAVGGRMPPGELQRITFDALRAVVTRFAVAGPTVLVLEDLHWADATSLRVTLDLAELAAGRHLLVLATSRPKSGRQIVEQLAASPATCRVTLRPLPADAAEALTESLIGQVPGATGGAGGPGPEVLAAVLGGADGNPLFLEERLSSLLETRTLVREGGTWGLREPSGPQLPQLLERLVRSRVDRLSPAAQEAIRAAAVLGPEFTAALLAAMLGTQPAQLAPVLDELCATDLIHHEPPEGLAGDFRFRHALIQDATYLGLLRPERRALHARAAAALAAASSDRLPEVAAVLGRHYAIAEDAERAVRFLELAADHATDAFANPEAISSFNAALEVTRGQPGTMDADAVRLHTKLAGVLWRIGRRERAGEAFRTGLRLAGAVDELQRAHLYTRLGRLELTNLRFAEAAAAFDVAEALLGDDPGGWDDATADQWLELMIDGRAAIHSMRSEPDLLRGTLERARPVLEARGTLARRHVFDRQVALERLVRHRYRVDDEAIAGFRRSLELAARADDEKDTGYATYFLGWALWQGGDLTEARQRSEAALAMAERIGETHLRSVSLMVLMLTAVRAHDPESLRTLIPRAMAAARDDSSHISGVMACQSWLAWQDGHPDQVIRLAGQIAEFDPATTAFGGRHRWVYLFPLIAARLRAGDTAAAFDAARQILGPSQQLLADNLTAALDAACASWDRADTDGERADAAAAELARALDLAHDQNNF
jgi:class 3 adenylate cyclase/DNA-binding SARP family transcriptional activator/tetratricopeptide (TPR) repeat protein